MDNLTPGTAAGALGGVGTILKVIGGMSAANASTRAGERQQAASNFEATQLQQMAGQATAASQRDALIERRRTALLMSRGIAVAAAGGGGVTDPTVEKLLTDITGEGSYRAAVALYQGEEKARQLELGATAKRFEGDVAAQGGRDRASAYRTGAFAGLTTGAASLYGKYGMGGPKNTKKTGPSFGWQDTGTPDLSIG